MPGNFLSIANKKHLNRYQSFRSEYTQRLKWRFQNPLPWIRCILIWIAPKQMSGTYGETCIPPTYGNWRSFFPIPATAPPSPCHPNCNSKHYIDTSLSSATWLRDLLINLGNPIEKFSMIASPKPLQFCEQILANITHLISRIALVPLRWRGLSMREELKQNRSSAIHSCIPCLPQSRLLSLHWLDSKP